MSSSFTSPSSGSVDGVAFGEGPATNPMGKPLFATYQTKADLPKEAGTRDFSVPVQGGH